MIIQIKEKDENLLKTLFEIWQSSVRASHHFISQNDLQAIAKEIPSYLLNVEKLYIYKKESQILAFAGTNQNCLEMLFVGANMFGKGIGKALLNFCMQKGVNELAVNEANTKALQFYQNMGFKISKRSEKDTQGRNYPLLFMKLEK
ncbi:GNAT family N-acetyltransferase [Campylobacter sp. MIT 12-5580]|uniref:GNAT family N-acetyltransferase n=1 Tax=Campylobacter sp. MIT 12-5580 TaxID=2040651 RepID=UPI0010F7BCC1|nr:GNAT family N-acetyltransferase [Campylobacter sp. MIT 12-5580]TKX28817.1 GNAT family N-acetyltransferase [Campylobacter sp. MIT 12-5580]